MFEDDVKVLRITPDAPGKGGVKISQNEWTTVPLNDIWDSRNVHVFQGGWRREPATQEWQTNGLQNTLASAIRAIHPFVRYVNLFAEGYGHAELLSSCETTDSGTNWADHGMRHVYDHTTGHVLLDGMQNESVAARMLTVVNRCLLVTGDREAQLYTGAELKPDGTGVADDPYPLDPTGLPVHYVYPLGVEAPEAAPVVSLTATFVVTQGYYGTAGQSRIVTPDPASLLATAGVGQINLTGQTVPARQLDVAVTNATVGTTKCCYAKAGQRFLALDGYLTSDQKAQLVGLDVTAGGNFGTIIKVTDDRDTPHVFWLAGWSSLVANATFLWIDKDNVEDVGKVTSTGGSGQVTGMTPPTPPSGILKPYATGAGEAVTLVGVSRSITQAGPPHDPYPLDVDSPALTVQEGGYWARSGDVIEIDAGTSAAAEGVFTWSAGYGPQYSYAWFDPKSGHVSNGAPITIVRHMEDVAGVSTEVDQTVPTNPRIKLESISWPDADTARRFTHILVFRNFVTQSGTNLFVVGGLDPSDSVNWKGFRSNLTDAIQDCGNIADGGDHFWEDSNTDESLLADFEFRLPRFTNGKPELVTSLGRTITPRMKEAAFWDGRLWLAGPDDPTGLYYSADRVQCTFGRPEESFPLGNRLAIPADDGQITGLRLWGERLLITTERWAYTVAGSNERMYRLIRISTRMSGVGPLQCDEVPGQIEGQTGALVYLHPDGRLYACAEGQDPYWLSEDIQRLLAACVPNRTAYNDMRVHVAQLGGRRLVAVTKTQQGAEGVGAFLYDLDQKCWYIHQQQPITAFATIYGTQFGPIELIGTLHGSPTVTGASLSTWLGYTALGGYSTAGGCYLATTELDFDGQKTRKQLMFVRVIGDSGVLSGSWPNGDAISQTVGTGLNDVQFDGDLQNYSRSASGTTYTLQATGTAAFKWKKDSGAFSGSVAMTGGWQSLSDTIVVRFPAATGYTTNDTWIIKIGPAWKVGVAVDGSGISPDIVARPWAGETLPYAAYRPAPNQREWIALPGARSDTGAAGGPMVGYRFRLTVKLPPLTEATECWAIDVGWKTVSERDA